MRKLRQSRCKYEDEESAMIGAIAYALPSVELSHRSSLREPARQDWQTPLDSIDVEGGDRHARSSLDGELCVPALDARLAAAVACEARKR
jgi:hypothetical protein